MIETLRRATRVVGPLALAVVVGSGITAATGLGGSPGTGTAHPAARATTSADPGEGAVTGRVAVSAVTVALSITTRGSRARPATEAIATVMNLMRTKLSGVVVSLKVDSVGVLIRPASSKTLNGISAGRAATTTWTLCSRVARNVVVVAEVRVNGVTTSSAPTTIRLPAAARC